jgi:DNA-binding NtrC family response regulator
MDFLFRQHYTLKAPKSPLQAEASAPLVLLVETEPESLALYASHLAKASMLVNVCLELSELQRQVRDIEPHLLIVNPSHNLNLALTVLRQIAKAHPGLPIITVGGSIPDPYLDRLMATGVALHLNRQLTQPRDIAVAARQILGLD